MKFKKIEKLINKNQDWLKDNPEEGKIWLKNKILSDISSLLYPENVTIMSKLLNINKDYIELFPNINGNKTIAASIVVKDSRLIDCFPQYHNDAAFYLKIITYYGRNSEEAYTGYRTNYFNIVPEHIAKEPDFIKQLLWNYITNNNTSHGNAFHYYGTMFPKEYTIGTQNYIKENLRKQVINNIYSVLNRDNFLIKEVFSKEFCEELRQVTKQKALSKLKKMEYKFQYILPAHYDNFLANIKEIEDEYKDIKETINNIDESKIKEKQIKEKKFVESVLSNLEEEIEKD